MRRQDKTQEQTEAECGRKSRSVSTQLSLMLRKYEREMMEYYFHKSNSNEEYQSNIAEVFTQTRDPAFMEMYQRKIAGDIDRNQHYHRILRALKVRCGEVIGDRIDSRFIGSGDYFTLEELTNFIIALEKSPVKMSEQQVELCIYDYFSRPSGVLHAGYLRQLSQADCERVLDFKRAERDQAWEAARQAQEREKESQRVIVELRAQLRAQANADQPPCQQCQYFPSSGE